MYKIDKTKLKGIIDIEHRRNGNIIDFETVRNTITNVGKAQVSKLINGISSLSYQWLAIGDSSTAASATDTSLANELTAPDGLDRISATTSSTTTTVTDDTAVLIHTFTNDSSSTIGVKEAGLFDTSTENGGNMLGRQTFAAKNLEQNDTLKITYKVQVA